jgi:adenylate cyclase
MPHKPGNLENLWIELKRRKVIHVITVYAAIAFVILQLVDLVAEPLRLPVSAKALVIVLLCIGFIIAVFVSWIYDITPAGIKKTNPVSTVKLTDRRTAKLSGGWRVATYISGFMIVALVALNFVGRSNLNKDISKHEKSIAVLPFDNLSNDPEQEYFSDGMMQEILNHLFKIGGLKIPSGTSSMRFKGSKLSVREISRELGVSFILEGNVSGSRDNVRIIVRLINCKDERLIWTEDYRRAMTASNLFEIQSDVAQHVAENMKIVISPEVKKRIENKPTENTEAYALFLKVLDSYSTLSFDQKKSMLERAISLDPGYADAYAMLANLWVLYGGHTGDMSRSEVLEKAEPLINTSLQLNKNSLLAHSVMSTLRLYYYWDFESVEREFQIFNQLNPSKSDLNNVFSDYLLASGKYDEAFTLAREAFDQDKNFHINWGQMALAYYFDGQQEKALETIENANNIFRNEDFLFTNSVRLLVYSSKYEDAIGLFEKRMAGKMPNELIPYYLGHLGIAYFKIGNKGRFETFLNELLTRSNKSSVGSPSFFAAAIYAAMGENNKSLQMLEKAFADHEVELYWLKVEPLFRSLHGEPQFKNLLTKIGFK